jgi:hypothetical protein
VLVGTPFFFAFPMTWLRLSPIQHDQFAAQHDHHACPADGLDFGSMTRPPDAQSLMPTLTAISANVR